jgi:hypothetical protein
VALRLEAQKASTSGAERFLALSILKEPNKVLGNAKTQKVGSKLIETRSFWFG